MKIISFLILSCFSLSVFGQSVSLGDTLKVSFLKMDKTISDSSRLFTAISYENISKKPVAVYKKLMNGAYGDKSGNIDLNVEKLVEGKYVDQQTMIGHHSSALLYSDSLRHYDLPKVRLFPALRDTLVFDFYRLGVGFYEGSYRVKLSLRILTFRDNTPYHEDPTGATAPPEDQIKYISSDWIYFTISKRIYQSR